MEQSAFPSVIGGTNEEGGGWIPGLSKREYFAAAALQGILSCPGLSNLGNREAAVLAVSYADQLCEVLGTPPGFRRVDPQ